MSFVAWVKKREKAIAPAMLVAALLLWVSAVVWHLLVSDVPLLSWAAVLKVYEFGLGGASGKPLEHSLLHVAELLGKGGATLALVYAYLRMLDVSVDRLWLRFFCHQHVVIVGLGDKARRLAASLRAQGRRVAVVELDEQHTLAATVRATGVAVVHGDGRAAEALQHAAVLRASALICLTGSDGANLQVALAARQLIKASRRRAPLRCVVHVADPALRQMASEANHYRHRDRQFDGHVLDVTDMAARGLLASHPPDPFAPVHRPDGEPLHVVVAGAGALARALVLNLALQAHHVQERRAVVTWLDAAAPQHLAELLTAYPALAQWLDIRVRATGALQLAAEDLPALAGTPVAMVYVLHDKDLDALAAGQHLARLLAPMGLQPAQIVVGIPPTSDALASIGVDDARTTFGFSTFDRYSICTADYLLGEKLDAEARRRHEKYLQQAGITGDRPDLKPTQRPWDQLDEMVKAFNRRQVEHEPVKRRMLERLRQADGLFPPDLVDVMARVEHRRWMASLQLSGWTYASHFDWQLRHHNNLVPFEQLDAPTQAFDRSVVEPLLAEASNPATARSG